MKKIFAFAFMLCLACAARAEFTCGPGYVLVTHQKIDGINAAECQKLWCMDLENGKMMGKDDAAYSGYKDTSGPSYLEVNGQKQSVLCWGERKWCTGQPAGTWDKDLGRYVRISADDAYQAYQNGSCFSWRVAQHNCKPTQIAKLGADGVWHCLDKEESVDQVRGSVIRRTSAPRRILR